MREGKKEFSDKAKNELQILAKAIEKILDITYECFAKEDTKIAFKVEPLEQVIDDLTKEIKNRHIERLQTGECDGELGIFMTDLLTNCERVSDHCSNVGVCVIQTRNSSFETHGYLNDLKYGRQPAFVGEFTMYQEEFHLN